MTEIIVDYDQGRKRGVLITEYLPVIREHFSVEDKDQAFKRRFSVGYRPPTRKYVITPQGRFEPRFIFSIIDFLKEQHVPFNITFKDSFKDIIKSPPLEKELVKLNLPLRDYQEETVLSALENKSGIILLPTSAGKTLVMATLVSSILKQHNLKTLILVPNLQLVTQSHADFIEYGIPKEDVTMWTGKYEPDLNAKIFISNVQILQSEKQDLSLLKTIGLLIVDEVHVCKKSNLINKILDQIPAIYRFGLTGTLPDNGLDQWNILGKFGKIIYKKKSYDLREQNYITQVVVAVIKLFYNNLPKFSPKSAINPIQAYEEEIQFLQTNNFRNSVIIKIVNKVDKNTLVLVDRIIHGEELLKVLQNHTKKNVYFVHGKIDVEEREEIRKLMEQQDDVVCIAISKIFSTGINIKNLHNIIFAAIGKAKIKIIQSIGRTLRKHASKKRATIFDIWDNLKYGNNHITERLSLYEEEKIPVTITEIKEKVD
jgi:superfamily II DNA or RNA helicase